MEDYTFIHIVFSGAIEILSLVHNDVESFSVIDSENLTQNIIRLSLKESFEIRSGDTITFPSGTLSNTFCPII